MEESLTGVKRNKTTNRVYYVEEEGPVFKQLDRITIFENNFAA